MRFDIRYETAFQYDQPVTESQNLLRACPTSDVRQHVLHYQVTTSPPARVHSWTDYWGTRVDSFGVRIPHDRLAVVATTAVETGPQERVTASPRRSELTDTAFRDEHQEFLEPSPHANGGRVVADRAAGIGATVDDDLVGLALALHRHVATSLDYRPGTTWVGVDVEDVFETGTGVCQDFAHAFIALARALGIPARYVSGYFFAQDERDGRDPDVDAVVVSTHAWAEVAIPGHGWWALDPTNRQQIGERHVKIGHGRDYDDVAPLRGVYTGAAEHDLEAEVTMRRNVQQQQQQ